MFHIKMMSIRLISLVLCALQTSASFVEQYAVVVDAGSTGSRGFVFRITIDSEGNRNVTSSNCGKVRPGLSSFAKNLTGVDEYFYPLIQKATEMVPVSLQKETEIYIKGTAGMRLLTEDEHDALWDHVIETLQASEEVPFKIEKENFGTISGHLEAFYAALASNYIAGSIDGNLVPIEGTSMIGALDMGGSSNQLIFYNGTETVERINASHFWSHSWLNYGVDKIKERTMDFLYQMHLADAVTKGKIIEYPCGFPDSEFPIGEGYILRGTGDPEKCIEIIHQVIWPADSVSSDEMTMETSVDGFGEMEVVSSGGCTKSPKCPVADIDHPEVHGHQFYAMSVYFFALDCIRALGPEPLLHWPNPTIDEMEKAAMKFCEMEWTEVHSKFQEKREHTYTRSYQLPDRCLEGLYIVTLLEKGFGFKRHDRSITIALEVEGSEVEWTLGYALHEISLAAENPTLVTNVKVELDTDGTFGSVGVESPSSPSYSMSQLSEKVSNAWIKVKNGLEKFYNSF